MRRHTRSAALALVALGSLACGRPDGGRAEPSADSTGSTADAGGTIVIAAQEPDALFPPAIAGIPGKALSDLMFDQLAMIGPGLNTTGDAGFEPRLADEWTWAPDSLSIAFHLDARARWHDGRPVRADDVRFSFIAYTDPDAASPHAESLVGIDSVTVRDSSTAVFWFRRRMPEQFFQAVYHMSIMPSHRFRDLTPSQYATSEAARSPVGSGRFRFVRWTPGAAVEVIADTGNYRGRARLDRVLWSATADPSTMFTRLVTGDADFMERIGPEVLAQVPRHADLRVHHYPGFSYAYMAFNLTDGASSRPHPVLADRELRRALTRALDRDAMVKNVWESLAVPALGPFVRAFASADTTIPQLAFDTAGASRTLDSLGWRDPDGDGVRERNGVPLAFTIIAPTSSPQRGQYAVLIQEQLRRIGAKVTIDMLEFNAFLERLKGGRFDAQMGFAMMDPTPATVRQFWGSLATRSKGLNSGSYTSRVFDAEIDSATTAFDPGAAITHYRRGYAAVVADAPAVWLYEPSPAAAVHRRIQVTGMRADAWWAGLADWSIAPGQRIDRDRIGLAARP